MISVICTGKQQWNINGNGGIKMANVEQAGFGGLGLCWVAGAVAVLCVICFFFGFGWW